MLLLSWADFFQKYLFFQKHYICIRVLNGLDPDQNQCSVGPDLGPNCLQRLSADDKTLTSIEERVKFEPVMPRNT